MDHKNIKNIKSKFTQRFSCVLLTFLNNSQSDAKVGAMLETTGSEALCLRLFG